MEEPAVRYQRISSNIGTLIGVELLATCPSPGYEHCAMIGAAIREGGFSLNWREGILRFCHKSFNGHGPIGIDATLSEAVELARYLGPGEFLFCDKEGGALIVRTEHVPYVLELEEARMRN